MKAQELNLESEIFKDFREKMNIGIRAMMANLIGKKLEKGSVTAKLTIELREHVTEDGELMYMPKIEPTVSLKMGAKGTLDCEKQAGFLMKSDGSGGYVIGTSQISMDELLEGKEERG